MRTTENGTSVKKTIATVALATGFVSLVLAHGEAAHGVTFFTDFATFDSATMTTVVEDFEAFAPKNTRLPSFTSNSNTYTGLAGSPSPNVFVARPGFTNFGVPVTTSTVLTANGDEDFTIDFGVPTPVVGFDTYLNAFGPATVQVFGTGGLLDSFVLSHDPTAIGFLGMVASESITSIRWTTVNGRSINTGIDNIHQGKVVATTPEPTATLGLLAFGALGIGAGIKRRQQFTH